jgi:uncharacterized membrane protein
MKIRNLALLAILAGVTSQIGIAQAQPCPSGTLANVIGISCSIGNLTFDFHNDFQGFTGVTPFSTNVFTVAFFGPDQIGFTPVQTDTQTGFLLNTHFIDNANGTGLFLSSHNASFSYTVQVNGAFQILGESSQIVGSVTQVDTANINAFDQQCFTNGLCLQVAPTVNFVPGFGSFNQPSASATLGIPALASNGTGGIPFTTAVDSFAFSPGESILDSASFLFSVAPQIPAPPLAKLRYKNIDLPGKANTFVTAINDRGQVAGSFQDFAGIVHGYIAKADGSELQVVDFPGSTFTVLDGINNNGDATGVYADNDGTDHGFVLRNGVITTLDFPDPGAVFNNAEGINDRGDVTGIYQNLVTGVHGYLFHDGNFTAIDDPNAFVFNGPGDVPFTLTELFSVNDRGSTAGFSVDGSNVGHSFILSGRVFRPVAVPAGVGGTFAFGLNAAEDTVGNFTDINVVNHGFLSTQGVLATVDVPNATSTFPSQINGEGQIVGSYTDSDGVFHSFLAEKDNGPDSGIGTALPLAEGHAATLNPNQKAPAPPCMVRQALHPGPATRVAACSAAQ